MIVYNTSNKTTKNIPNNTYVRPASRKLKPILQNTKQYLNKLNNAVFMDEETSLRYTNFISLKIDP